MSVFNRIRGASQNNLPEPHATENVYPCPSWWNRRKEQGGQGWKIFLGLQDHDYCEMLWLRLRLDWFFQLQWCLTRLWFFWKHCWRIFSRNVLVLGLQLKLWHSLVEADWAIGHRRHTYRILPVVRRDSSPILPKGCSHNLGIRTQGR